jgi:hypothetical protein
MKNFISICCVLLVFSMAKAQDTLPNFKAVNLYNGRVILSWKNNYNTLVKQLSIQRSTDSLKNFKTLATMPNPAVPLNGYSDNKATPGVKYYYKFYIILEGNVFINTKSRVPVVDTSWKKTKINITSNDVVEVTKPKKPEKVPVPVPQYVFNSKSGDIVLKLKDAGPNAAYKIIFYDKQNKILELNDLTEKYFIIDKVNFVKKGCYNYQIFFKDNLLEQFNICL